MDIMGLSKRVIDSFQQLTPKPNHTEKISQPLEIDWQISKGEKLQNLAARYDVSALPLNDLIPLQEDLSAAGFIQPHELRAKAMLPSLAYQHMQSGPIDVEQAISEKLQHMKGQTAVLAAHREGQHLLVVIKNLRSAREQSNAAA
jgi:hypothetical protein